MENCFYCGIYLHEIKIQCNQCKIVLCDNCHEKDETKYIKTYGYLKKCLCDGCIYKLVDFLIDKKELDYFYEMIKTRYWC